MQPPFYRCRQKQGRVAPVLNYFIESRFNANNYLHKYGSLWAAGRCGAVFVPRGARKYLHKNK